MRIAHLLSLIILVLGLSAAYSTTNTYDAYFKAIDISKSDVLVQALHVDDLDMVYGSLKRIGELKLTNNKKDIYDWMAQSNPVANQGKENQSQDYRNIFRISIWAISQMGDEKDAQELITYLKDIKKHDKETQRILIQALGDIRPSGASVSALNRLTQEITDQAAAEDLLAAIMKHNSKLSANYLIIMSQKVVFSPEFRKRLEDSALQLIKAGN